MVSNKVCLTVLTKYHEEFFNKLQKKYEEDIKNYVFLVFNRNLLDSFVIEWSFRVSLIQFCLVLLLFGLTKKIILGNPFI